MVNNKGLVESWYWRGPKMNWNGMIDTFIGVANLIYVISCRKKVNFHNRRSVKALIRANEFLRLQLYFSILGSAFLVLYGILVTIFNLNNVLIIVGFLPFHLINLILLIVSKRKGYIDY